MRWVPDPGWLFRDTGGISRVDALAPKREGTRMIPEVLVGRSYEQVLFKTSRNKASSCGCALRSRVYAARVCFGALTKRDPAGSR